MKDTKKTMIRYRKHRRNIKDTKQKTYRVFVDVKAENRKEAISCFKNIIFWGKSYGTRSSIRVQENPISDKGLKKLQELIESVTSRS